MVTPGGALREFAEHWTPIFADPQRQYDYAAAILSHEEIEGGVRLSLRTEGGETLRVELTFVTPEVFRLRAWLDAEPPDDSPMLVEGARRRHTARVGEDDGAVVVDSGALRVRLARSRWAMTVEDAAGRALISPSQDNTLLRVPFVLPLGFSRGEDGRRLHGLHHLRHEDHGGDLARVAARLRALRDNDVDAGRDLTARVLGRADQRGDQQSPLVRGLDDVRRRRPERVGQQPHRML